MSFEIANASQAISSEIVCQHIRLEMSCNTPVILRNAPKLELKCCKYKCTYAIFVNSFEVQAIKSRHVHISR